MSQNQKRKRPIIELVDLRVTAQTIKLIQPFTRVERIIVLHNFDGDTVDYDEFANDTILTNGIQLLVDNRPLLPEPIKAMRDYMRYAFDTDFASDTKGVAKESNFTARFTFRRFIWPEGINAVERDIEVVIQDDLSARGNILTWSFQGWTWDR